jgi:hypothetical protein
LLGQPQAQNTIKIQLDSCLSVLTEHRSKRSSSIMEGTPSTSKCQESPVLDDDSPEEAKQKNLSFMLRNQLHYFCYQMSIKVGGGGRIYTVKLGYNYYGCNEVTAIAKKCYLQVTFTSI